MADNELFGISEQLESCDHEKDHVADPTKMVGDLISRKFGMLTVIEFAGYHTTPCGTKRRLWKCRCDCGAEKIVQEPNLKNGTTKSCGCWKYRKIKEHNTKHGGSKDRLYGIWKGMKRRCNDSRDSHYATYGGKGIKVCDEWANDYAVFKEWAYKNGYDENSKTGDCSIDRINNNGNYEPNNCRWVNRIQQANNTSQNRYVTLNGKRLTIAEFARTMNISPFKARYRIELFEKGDTNESSLIERQAAIDALGERPVVWSDNDDYTLGARNQYDMDRLALETVPSAQQWIPWDSGKFPKESGTYTVTAYDGATKRVTYAKYQKRLKRWELTGARAYWRVLAWLPPLEPYREDTP